MSISLELAAVKLEIAVFLAAAAKEYEAPWLKNSGTVVREGGRFASKGNSPSNSKTAKETSDNNLPIPHQEALLLPNILQQEIEYAQSPSEIQEVIVKRLIYLDPVDLMAKPPQKENSRAALKFLEDRGQKIVDIAHSKETNFLAVKVRDKRNQDTLYFAGITDIHGWISNAIDKENGNSQYNSHRSKIKQMLEASVKDTGKKAIVSGHSLGGALSQFAVTEFPELIKEVHTYNSASIATATLEKYLAKTQALAQQRKKVPTIIHSYHSTDLIPGLKGDAVLPGEVKIYAPEDSDAKISPNRSHMDLFSNPSAKLVQIN